MSYSYNFIEHTADIAAEISGDSLNELFTASAFAWKEAVTDNKIEPAEVKELNLKESSVESLLVQFLNDLNFLLNTGKWIFGKLNRINVLEQNREFYLNALIAGEPFDENMHELKEEIKSVTYHQLEVKKINGSYFSRIVFDI